MGTTERTPNLLGQRGWNGSYREEAKLAGVEGWNGYYREEALTS